MKLFAALFRLTQLIANGLQLFSQFVLPGQYAVGPLRRHVLADAQQSRFAPDLIWFGIRAAVSCPHLELQHVAHSQCQIGQVDAERMLVRPASQLLSIKFEFLIESLPRRNVQFECFESDVIHGGDLDDIDVVGTGLFARVTRHIQQWRLVARDNELSVWFACVRQSELVG